jgi:hypothetical protein
MFGRVLDKSLLIRVRGLRRNSRSLQTIKIMKTFLLCFATLFIIISCSADYDNEKSEIIPQASESSGKIYDNDNPFDLKGRQLYEALNLYYKENQSPKSVAELTHQIRLISQVFPESSNVTSRLIPFTDEMVDSIMADPDNSMIQIVQNSTLQLYAKNNLITFLQNLIIKRQQEFSITNNFITGYESEVLTDSVFTSQEVETILTVASISRYSLYSEVERKDKDWDILVGSKPAKSLFKNNERSIVIIIALLDKIL